MENLSSGTNNTHSTGSGMAGFDLTKVLDRVKSIIVDPKAAWQNIRSESDSAKDIYLNYFLVLAALPAVAGFIKSAVIGISIPGIGTFRAPFFAQFGSSVISFLTSCVVLYLAALIVQWLAPRFEGKVTVDAAVRFWANAWIPALVGGIFVVVPWIGWIVALGFGIYSIYVAWLGLSPMTGVPEARRLPFFGMNIVVTFVCALVISIALQMFAPNTSPPLPSFSPESSDVDMKKLEQGLKEFQKLVPNVGGN